LKAESLQWIKIRHAVIDLVDHMSRSELGYND